MRWCGARCLARARRMTQPYCQIGEPRRGAGRHVGAVVRRRYLRDRRRLADRRRLRLHRRAASKSLPRVADASSVDSEAILALRPSVVIGIPAQQRLTEPLRRARVRVVLLPDDSFGEIFENLQTIGTLTGHRREAERRLRACVVKPPGYTRKQRGTFAIRAFSSCSAAGRFGLRAPTRTSAR